MRQWRGALWLGDQQAGHEARKDEEGERDIGRGPSGLVVFDVAGAQPFGQKQCAGARQQHGDAVAGHVARRQRGLQFVLGDFQPIGIDGDVLSGRGESHRHGKCDQHRQVLLRVAQGHAD